MRALDLFSGIGGFALAGRMVWGDDYQVQAFCEIEPFCQKVLKKHWPDVPIETDIKSMDGKKYAGTIDLITGGFPCQDISAASTTRTGLQGERSGLWWRMFEIISQIRPRFILLENSSELLYRGVGDILQAMAKIGYDSEWHCLPAAYVGAPHIRDRAWILSYPTGLGWPNLGKELQTINVLENVWEWRQNTEDFIQRNHAPDEYQGDPELIRIGDGLSAEMDRIKSLGNAIVPQVAAQFMRAIKNPTEMEATQ